MEPPFILDATISEPSVTPKVLFEKLDLFKVGESFIFQSDHHTKSFYHLLKSHHGHHFLDTFQ